MLLYQDWTSSIAEDGIDLLRLTDNFETISEVKIFPKPIAQMDAMALADGSLAFAGLETPANSRDILAVKTSGLATISTDVFLGEKAVFLVVPNPLGSSDFLTIELEDAAFSGPFRVEIWTLDGRLFSVFEKEKRLERETFLIEKGLPSGAFFVRVLTEKGAGQKLVLRF